MSQAALGQAIREAREKAGMSLRALARVAKLSAPFMSDLEHGRRSTDRLPQIAEALGVPIQELRYIEARIDADLKTWIEEHPGLVALLRECRATRRPVSCGPRKVRF